MHPRSPLRNQQDPQGKGLPTDISSRDSETTSTMSSDCASESSCSMPVLDRGLRDSYRTRNSYFRLYPLLKKKYLSEESKKRKTLVHMSMSSWLNTESLNTDLLSPRSNQRVGSGEHDDFGEMNLIELPQEQPSISPLSCCKETAQRPSSMLFPPL